MAFSVISSVQSMVRKLADTIYGSPSSSSSSSDQVLSGMKKDLESLERTLRRIQAVLNDAEEREIGDASVKLWLKELRWVAYDAENVLGEYQYEIRRPEIITSVSAAETSLKRKKPHDDQVYDFTSVLLRLLIPQKIRDIVERFEEISKARKDLQFREEDGTRRCPMSYVPQPSSSLVDESGIFGREDDKEAVIQMLLSDKVSSKISVISIVGMGGLGKTTLAQCLYNDPRIRQYFDSKGWVCVSEDFDVKRLTGEIIQSITKNSCGLTQLDGLQSKLKEIVDGKKVLVVLDDVWNEKPSFPSFWESLKVPFLSAATTRVLVTTRNESIAKMMQTVNNMDMYRLGCLPEDNCWSLFCHHAFSGRNQEEHPRLVEIGKKIVQKCGRLPLVVKRLGSLVLYYGTDEESWRDVLESEMWELDRAKDDILPALKLSYYCMPTHLKPCFLFTSLYPKDFKFEKDKVIKMWMAQDYILPRGNKRLEDIGSEYFDELERRSFFLYDDSSKKYVLHDIVHDLARHISENEHHSVVLESDGKVCPIPAEVRHLFVKCQRGATLCQVPLENTRDLRTLIVSNRHWSDDYSIVDCQFEHSVHLRVLEVDCERRLPYSIVNLKHLCFLDWNHRSSLSINNGSSSLSHLYNMQTLYLYCEHDFVRLFSSLRDLANLRHLHLESYNKSDSTCILPSMPDANLTQRGICYSSTFSKLLEITLLHSIGRAEWLSFLPFSQMPSLRRLQVAPMECLKRVGHENYCYCPFHLGGADIRESVITNNVGFPCLEELIFEDMPEWKEWSGVMDGDFPCLRKLTLANCFFLSQIPMLPSSLKTLHISHCNSLKSLLLNNEQIRFPYMEELVFDDMPDWEEWPGLNSGDFPCLRKLTFTHCIRLRRFPVLPSSLDKNHGQQVGFPCLEELLFEYMWEWKEWSGVMDGDFPCLRELTLKNCLSLSQIPVLPSSLKTLHISNCNSLKSLPVNHGHIRFPYMEEVEFCNMPKWEEWPGLNSGDFPCLRRLTIKRCNKLRRFPLLPSSLDKNHWQQVGFPFLEEIVIEDIPELQQEWFGVSDGYFPCLRELTINRCQKLQGVPTLLSSSLKLLSIKSCWSLTSLAGLQNLTSLESLDLERCPNLHISPQEEEGLPSKPQHVKIVDCPILQEWCNMHHFNCIQEYYGSAELTIYDSDTIIKDLGVNNLTSLQRLELRAEGPLPSDGWLPPMIQILEVFCCNNLYSLPLHQNLLLLTRLEIQSCPVFCDVRGLHNLPNLEELSIASCPRLYQLLPDNSLPSSLQSLSVIDCKELWSLPLLHENLSSLEKLEVLNCPELTIIAGLHNLFSIKTLIIRQCPRLLFSSDEKLSSMPHFLSIADCPALEEWCQQQSIPYSQTSWLEEWRQQQSNTYCQR